MSMDKNLFESSEFYSRRYKNFSTLIIIPIFSFFCLCVVFCCFAKREITLKVAGEIQPVKIISEIQSTSMNEIIENNLSENERINKGDLLIRYNNNSNDTQRSYIQTQLDEERDQQEKLKMLKQGIESEKEVFLEKDNYGYSNILSDYFSQKEVLKETASKENADIQNQNATIDAVKTTIDEEIQIVQDKMANYILLKETIQDNHKTLNSTDLLYPLYDSYKRQIDVTEDKESVRKQIIAEIQNTITQLDGTLSNYRTQKASAGSYIQPTSTLDDQLSSLKSQQLLNVDKELITIQTKITELESNLALQQELDRKNRIESPTSGIIHLSEEIKGKKIISEGTTIAQIYPYIVLGEFVDIVIYINSQDISSVHIGDKVHFESTRELADSFVLNSCITEIANAPERTENGNFFKVIAKAEVNKQNQQSVRYGIQGKSSIITGEKTYFDYYKDKLLNKN
ncbi:bacteriocin secretion accessory protein [Listeria monocytogenes]|nr:bacteriocin secretion accessory protein [Listeria monocytogenes]